MLVPGSAACVELALSNDLVQGQHYQVTAVGVPAVDATVTPGGTSELFWFGSPIAKHKIEPNLRDRERALFKSDIIWTGADYEELPNGDLARADGQANVTKALWRSVETAGLPWDPSWGVDVREYVDSPSPTAGTLRGALVAQLMRDRRVREVSSEVSVEDEKTIITLKPVLIGGISAEPVSTVVPNADS